LVAALAAGLFVAAGGRRSLGAASLSLRFLARANTRIERRAAILLAVVVVAIGVLWSSRAAGGSDSYGYVSEAELWLSGHLTLPQPWVRQVPWPNAEWQFAPLAYLPRGGNLGPADRTSLVPKYSPGLPMLMALAKLIAGQPAVFWVVPLFGGLLVAATYGIGVRLGSSRAGLVAAWLVATSPAVLFMLTQPMSDVPAAGAWALTLWCVFGDTRQSAIGAGLAAGMAVLIRPNLVPLAGIMAVWLAVRAWQAAGADRRQHVRRAILFSVGLAPAIAVTATLNRFWYGSPLRSGYEGLSDLFAWSNIAPNVRNYAQWFADTQTPFALMGVAALLVPGALVWPRDTRRSFVVLAALFVLALWAEYCAYIAFDTWSYLRFLLPAWPLIMIGLAVVILRPARSGRPVIMGAAMVLVVGLGLHNLRVAIERYAFDLQQGEAKYASVGALVRARTDPNAMILSMQHSGSLRYYGGRMTLDISKIALRFDEAALDHEIAWLAAHGSHPYAVLEWWEVREFRERFGQTNIHGRLAMTPLVDYRGPSEVFVFDLLRPETSTGTTEIIFDRPHPVASLAPAPPPTIVFTNLP
jgi:hypothetical protein